VVVAEHKRELQQCHPGQVGGICLAPPRSIAASSSCHQRG